MFEHYGDILFKNGKKEEAINQWKKANLVGKDRVKLKEKLKRVFILNNN